LRAQLQPAAGLDGIPRLGKLDLDGVELDALVGSERRPRTGIGQVDPLTLIFCRPSRRIISSTSFFEAARALVRASVTGEQATALRVAMIFMVFLPGRQFEALALSRRCGAGSGWNQRGQDGLVGLANLALGQIGALLGASRLARRRRRQRFASA
jgi:hypothetical protein